MSLEQEGEQVLDRVFQTFVKYSMRILNSYKYQIPLYLQPFLTPRTINWALSYVHRMIPTIPPDIKRQIAIEVHGIMSDIDDAYVRSVLHGKPNKDLAMIEQDMGELVWSGV